jgi:hypothetical protein
MLLADGPISFPPPDVLKLRHELRIIGEAAGTLPTSTKQNRLLGVPVVLLPEQARLLCDKGMFKALATLADSTPPPKVNSACRATQESPV